MVQQPQSPKTKTVQPATSTPYQQWLVEEVQKIYAAEERLMKTFPKMKKIVTDTSVKRYLDQEKKRSKQERKVLRQIFQELEQTPESKENIGMNSILEAKKTAMNQSTDQAVKNYNMMVYLRSIKSFEISSYYSAQLMAQSAGNEKVAGSFKKMMAKNQKGLRKLEQLVQNYFKKIAEAETPK